MLIQIYCDANRFNLMTGVAIYEAKEKKCSSVIDTLEDGKCYEHKKPWLKPKWFFTKIIIIIMINNINDKL